MSILPERSIGYGAASCHPSGRHDPAFRRPQLGGMPVKVTVEPLAPLRHDLVAYAEAPARETGQSGADPVRLIVPTLKRFIASIQGFAKAWRPAS